MQDYNKAVTYIKEKIQSIPQTAIILGSGLGLLGDRMKDCVELNYKDIPGFPVSTAPGHKGRLLAGTLNGKPLLAMQGRFHYYEGYDMKTVVYPIRIFSLLGIKNLIVTNAAGGVNMDFTPGDLMLITDHIKFGHDHPLIGANEKDFGERFTDMSNAYNKDLRVVARSAAKKQDVDLKEGVYMFFTGPTYETPAEIHMARALGADAVGMSTVPEVITAAHCGLNVIGISCITNMAAGILDQPITEEEVIEIGKLTSEKFASLIGEIIANI